MNLLALLGSTVLLRPYVFVFFALFLWSGIRSLGLRRTLLFTGIAYAVAFLSEYSSTRIGIPFGFYYYIDATRDRELWISNVPFMDSLSFTFLSYASYALARLFTFTHAEAATGRDRCNRHLRAAVLSGLFMMTIDLVIDPLALRGDRWFLGKIYGYPEPGLYFGVPMANFFGWAAVGAAIVFAFRAMETRLAAESPERLGRAARLGVRLEGPALYAVVLVFNLTMTWMIGERFLTLTGILLFVPIGIFFILRLADLRSELRKAVQAKRADLPDISREFH